MNLRILKKLSKRAAPMLPALDDHRQQFKAERGDNYTSTLVLARKNFERLRSPGPDTFGDHHIKVPARDGHGGFISLHPPHHPLKGTMMVGGMSGGESPEWDEETAWDALQGLVLAHFTDWGCSSPPEPTRVLDTPAQIFAAATDLIGEKISAVPFIDLRK